MPTSELNQILRETITPMLFKTFQWKEERFQIPFMKPV